MLNNSAEMRRARLLMLGDENGVDALMSSPDAEPKGPVEALISAIIQLKPLPHLFKRAGVTEVPQRKWALRIVTEFLVCALLSVFVEVRISILAVILLAIEMGMLKRKAYHRAEGFERDYPAFLLSLASAVRTGLDPLVALTQSSVLFKTDTIIGEELTQVKKLIDKGALESEALKKFAATVAHPDVALFRSAFVLSRRHGSSLSECLQRLTRVTRQRQSFRRKMRAAVAMQRLSAIGIAVCTIIIGTIQWSANPAAMTTALENPMGRLCLSLGTTLILLGLGWMLRMTRAKI